MVQGADGQPVDPEAGAAGPLGKTFSEAVEDALIFADVHYPLRDEDIDVVLEPVLTVSLDKNGLTNALKVLPCVVLPWVDGFGFDYDHAAVLEVRVLNARQDRAHVDSLRGESAMIAERYPSILWVIGIHVGLAVLTILESATTDYIVLQQLVQQSFARAVEPVTARLIDELSPVAKPCPEHEGERQPGRFCVVDGRDLYYPMLLRGAARWPAPP